MKVKAEKRKKLGKKSKLLKEESQIPAVVYGKDVKSKPIKVEVKSFDDVYIEAGQSTLVDLTVGRSKSVKVLIQEVQRDPVTNDYIHVSFYQIDLKKDIAATVPIVLEGEEESPAVEEEGGVIIQPVNEIEIRCKPLDLPPEIKIDVIKMRIGDNIIAGDIDLPKGVSLIREEDKEQVLVTGTMPTEEEVPEEEVVDEEAEPVEGEEVEGEAEEGEKPAEGEKPEPGKPEAKPGEERRTEKPADK